STSCAASKGKVPEMLERGVTVGLGADSTATSNRLDMFRAMRQMATALSEAHPVSGVVRPEKALEMATVDGARALGWDGDIGSAEAGKRADLIVVDTRRTIGTPMEDLSSLASLVYASEGADVETTVVDGRVLMENRQLTTIDVDRVRGEAQRIAERIV